jgi:hypothetical protein
MVEITYQMVLSTLQTTGILVGIVYYITIMRNQQRTRELALKAQEHATETRQTQIFMRLFEQLNNAVTYASWAELVNMEIEDEEYLQKYDSSVNPIHFGKRAHLWFTFNTIGELLLMGIVKPELIHRLTIPPMVITMWEGWEHIIKATRVRENSPELWNGFEHLYNEMIRLRKERGYPERTYPKQSENI